MLDVSHAEDTQPPTRREGGRLCPLRAALLVAIYESDDGTTVAIGKDEVDSAIALRDAGEVSLSDRQFSPDRVSLSKRHRSWLFCERSV